MAELSARERALVGLGAALGSNCMPCIEHHVPLARKAGLSDEEIEAALTLADNIRQVPARRVLAAGRAALAQPADGTAPTACAILDPVSPASATPSTVDAMTATVSRLLAQSPAPAAKSAGACTPKAAAQSDPAKGRDCC